MKNAIALIALLAINSQAIDYVGGGDADCVTDCEMETLRLTDSTHGLTVDAASTFVGSVTVKGAIAATGTAPEVIIDRSQASDAAGSGHALKITGNAAGAYTTIGLFKGAVATGYFGYGNSGSILTGAGTASLAFRAENDLHFGAGGNNLGMTLQGTNLGIGTASPASKLDVSGDAQFGSGVSKSTFSATGSLALGASSSLTVSSAALFGVTITTQASAGAGAATTATCPAGKFVMTGGCDCTGGVAITTTEFYIGAAFPVAGVGVSNKFTCQQQGGPGGACAVWAQCGVIQ